MCLVCIYLPGHRLSPRQKFHMKKLQGLFLLIILQISICSFSQEPFKWPDTYAGKVYEEFLIAYNSGDLDDVRQFISDYYGYTESGDIDRKTDYWMDIYYRLGPATPHETTIDDEYDLEVWLQGSITKTWFAPELILNKETKKIRANGLLLGDQPRGMETPSGSEIEFIERLGEYLNSNESHGLFQGVVLVAKNDSVILNRAYGKKNIDAGLNNKVSTRMKLSSITKVFTSTAVLQLVKQGKLSLSKTIDNYLPEMPVHISGNITITQLLLHTSNYELDGIDGFREEEAQCRSLEEIYLAQLKYLPDWEKYNDFETATRFDYSNDSYNLLALIVERVSEVDFNDYLNEHIFQPLEMNSTSFLASDAMPYRYDISVNGLKDFSDYYPLQVSGAYGLVSTVSDLQKFHKGLFSNKILDFAYASGLYFPFERKGGSEYQGLGMTTSYSQELNIGHSGVNIGNSAEYRHFPESGYTLIALCNNRSGASNIYNFFKNNLPRN